jgi:hypothetical protein
MLVMVMVVTMVVVVVVPMALTITRGLPSVGPRAAVMVVMMVVGVVAGRHRGSFGSFGPHHELLFHRLGQHAPVPLRVLRAVLEPDVRALQALPPEELLQLKVAPQLQRFHLCG